MTKWKTQRQKLLKRLSDLGITKAIDDPQATVGHPGYPAIRLVAPAPPGRTTGGYWEEFYTGLDEPEYEAYLKSTFGDK